MSFHAGQARRHAGPDERAHPGASAGQDDREMRDVVAQERRGVPRVDDVMHEQHDRDAFRWRRGTGPGVEETVGDQRIGDGRGIRRIDRFGHLESHGPPHR
jgi:hypothetical protein